MTDKLRRWCILVDKMSQRLISASNQCQHDAAPATDPNSGRKNDVAPFPALTSILWHILYSIVLNFKIKAL
jgi:hypothetical protein